MCKCLNWDSWDLVLVVGGVVVMDGVVVWLVCPAPPRALTLTLSRRAGEGMIVADEGVAAVVGWWWFGWQGGSRTAPTGWLEGSSRTGMGVAAVMEGLVVWLEGQV